MRTRRPTTPMVMRMALRLPNLQRGPLGSRRLFLVSDAVYPGS